MPYTILPLDGSNSYSVPVAEADYSKDDHVQKVI